MNIFYFYDCPKLSAKAQPDKMLVKMPLETAQMLCTAHRVLDGDTYADLTGLYKTAYKNHPCTIWARESIANYAWLYAHFHALNEEYEYRYGREHGSYAKLSELYQDHQRTYHRQNKHQSVWPCQTSTNLMTLLSHTEIIVSQKNIMPCGIRVDLNHHGGHCHQ